MELAIPRALQGLAEGVRRGKAMLLPGLSPEQRDRAERHIEGAIGLFGHLVGGGEHTEEIGAHLHGLAYGRPAEAVHFAVRLVVRKRGVQLGDAVKGGAECLIRLAGVRCIQLDADQRAHVGLDGLE